MVEKSGLSTPERLKVVSDRLETASRILGQDFFGPEAVKKTFGIEIPFSSVPDLPFSEERLERARELGQFLVLRTDKAPDGSHLTMKKMQELLDAQSARENKGNVPHDTDRLFQDEMFFMGHIRPSWALVSKEPIPNSRGKNYLQQTEALVAYIQSVFGKTIPTEYVSGISEFEIQKNEIGEILAFDWHEAARRLSELEINKAARHSEAEASYDGMVYFKNTGRRWLAGVDAWSNTLIPGGYFIKVNLSTDGVYVSGLQPGVADQRVGIYASLAA